MLLTVTSAAREDDFPIEVSEVESRLGLTGHTAEITAYCEAVRDLFSERVGFDIRRQGYSATFAAPRNPHELQLPVWPVDPDQVTLTVDGDVAATTTYTVKGPSGLIRRNRGFGYDADEDANAATFFGGWIMPTRLAEWAAGSKVVGDWVYPTAGNETGLLYEVTVAGTLVTEPTWPTTAGATVASGATFTARRATALPRHMRELAFQAVADFWRNRKGKEALVSQRAEGFSETYSQDASSSEVGLPPNVARGLSRYRMGFSVA